MFNKEVTTEEKNGHVYKKIRLVSSYFGVDVTLYQNGNISVADNPVLGGSYDENYQALKNMVERMEV